MRRRLLLMAIITCMALLVLSSFGQVQPVTVSLEQVVKSPDSYHGKLIQVTGFFVYAFEKSALYPSTTRQHQGIWVTPNDEMLGQRANLKGHYLKLTGVFNAHNHGHMGNFGGNLAVKKFELVEEPKGQ